MKEKSIFTSDYRKMVSKIKKARMETGFSQKDLAKKIKRTQSYISKIELAQLRIDIVQIKEISKALNRSIDYFLN